MIWLADQTVVEVMARAQKAARNSHSTVEIEKEPSSTLTSIFLVRKDGSRSLYRRFNTRLTGAEITACIEQAEKDSSEFDPGDHLGVMAATVAPKLIILPDVMVVK